MNKSINVVFALLVAGTACSSPPRESNSQDISSARRTARETKRNRPAGGGSGSFEIVLGEWAVTPEADAVAPGPIRLRIVNRGSMTHGFEIESDLDHSGPGGGDGFKFETRLIEPGDAVNVRLDLAPGIYKIECLVDGHDDRGMEGFLEVRRGAGRGTDPESPPGGTDVAIEGFAFAPPNIAVTTGTQVTWINADSTEHTVTGEGFDSNILADGDEFSHRFEQPGTYRYRCAIHPEMTGRVSVTG